jgi:hypothetical protein
MLKDIKPPARPEELRILEYTDYASWFFNYVSNEDHYWGEMFAEPGPEQYRVVKPCKVKRWNFNR